MNERATRIRDRWKDIEMSSGRSLSEESLKRIEGSKLQRGWVLAQTVIRWQKRLGMWSVWSLFTLKRWVGWLTHDLKREHQLVVVFPRQFQQTTSSKRCLTRCEWSRLSSIETSSCGILIKCFDAFDYSVSGNSVRSLISMTVCRD